MATYATTSPYYGTPMFGPFLDTWKSKTISPAVDDAHYQIDPVYNLRPDILAYDLYKDSNLWWVFALRNPNVLKDPLFGFRAGVIIYVPTLATLKTAIGI